VPLIKNFISTQQLDQANKLLTKVIPETQATAVTSSFLDYAVDIKNSAELLSPKGKLYYQFYQKTKDPKDLTQSVAWYRSTYQFLNDVSQKYGEGINPEFISILNQINSDALAVLYEALQLHKDQEETYLAEILSIIEFEKSFTQNANQQKATAEILMGIPKPVYEAETKIKKNIKRLLLHIKKDRENTTLTTALAAQLSRLDSLKTDLAQKYPVYQQAKYYDFKFDYKALVQKVTQEQTNLLSFYYTSSHLYRIWISAKGTKISRIPIDQQFEKSILAHIAALKSYQTNTYQTTGSDLYQQLFQDLDADIHQGSLLVVPHKLLHLFPFGTLITKDNFLIRQQPIAYTTSLFKWIAPNATTSDTSKVLLMAPVFENQTTKNPKRAQLTALKHSLTEVTQIGNLFESKQFQHQSATKDNFIKHKDYYNVLHLATHVALNNQSPLETRIIFASDSTDTAQDLHLYEILNSKIAADMVVLSACETGVGDIKKGIGVQSLATSFANAGAKSTVMSLWQVDDIATSTHMQQFYQHLKDGYTKDGALQQAKQDYLAHTEDQLLQHPYYWAGFVVSGHTTALTTNNSWIWYVLMAAFVFALYAILKRMKR
jgi:CHAT domain-containing protein